MYDHQAIPVLESEARAAAHHLAAVLAPVQRQQADALAAFALETATPEAATHHQAVERLLAAMQAYCEAAGALNEQLATNLAAAVDTAQREARRAAHFLYQFRLTHADLLRQQQFATDQAATFQTLLRRAA